MKDDRDLSEKIKLLEEERKNKKEFLEFVITQEWKAKHNEENTDSLVSLKTQKTC